MKFRNRRTNEIKTAFNIFQKEDKDIIYVQFSEKGKAYSYRKENIEILQDELEETKNTDRIIIYEVERECYKCGKKTNVLTYLLYDDETNESMVFPWNKERLEEYKSMDALLLHMENPEIEFYPIKILGSDSCYDQKVLKAFPDRIQKKYSYTEKRKYAMNLCQHCGAKQGAFFVYARLNKLIQAMQPLKIFKVL